MSKLSRCFASTRSMPSVSVSATVGPLVLGGRAGVQHGVVTLAWQGTKMGTGRGVRNEGGQVLCECAGSVGPYVETVRGGATERGEPALTPVSYTHLTLPT